MKRNIFILLSSALICAGYFGLYLLRTSPVSFPFSRGTSRPGAPRAFVCRNRFEGMLYSPLLRLESYVDSRTSLRLRKTQPGPYSKVRTLEQGIARIHEQNLHRFSQLKSLDFELLHAVEYASFSMTEGNQNARQAVVEAIGTALKQANPALCKQVKLMNSLILRKHGEILLVIHSHHYADRDANVWIVNGLEYPADLDLLQRISFNNDFENIPDTEQNLYDLGLQSLEIRNMVQLTSKRPPVGGDPSGAPDE